MKVLSFIFVLALLNVKGCVPHAVLESNRQYFDDSYEGVWGFVDPETGSVSNGVAEVRKKDGYWLYVKMLAEEGKKEEFYNATLHEFDNLTILSLRITSDNGKKVRVPFHIKKEGNLIKLYTMDFVTDEYANIFENTPEELQESLFQKYLDKGAIYPAQKEIYTLKKRYELLKD